MVERLTALLLTLTATLGCAEATPTEQRDAAAAPASRAVESTLRSGVYEGLLLAVSPDGRIVGRFREELGGSSAPCAFGLSGTIRDGQAIVRATGRSLKVTGRLSASGDGVVLHLPQMRSLSGCIQVLSPDVEGPKGLALSRTGDGAWTDLAEVRATRASLRATPGGTAGRAYVVKGDVVGVMTRQGTNVRVIYPSDRRSPSQGWVAATELGPLTR